MGNILAFKQQLTGGRRLKAAYNPQGRGFAAAGRSQQGNEFLFADVQIDIIQYRDAVELLGNALQLDQPFILHHVCVPP